MDVLLMLNGFKYEAKVILDSMIIESDCEIFLPAPNSGLIMLNDETYCKIELKDGRYHIVDDDISRLKSFSMKIALEKELTSGYHIKRLIKV